MHMAVPGSIPGTSRGMGSPGVTLVFRSESLSTCVTQKKKKQKQRRKKGKRKNEGSAANICYFSFHRAGAGLALACGTEGTEWPCMTPCKPSSHSPPTPSPHVPTEAAGDSALPSPGTPQRALLVVYLSSHLPMCSAESYQEGDKSVNLTQTAQ